MAFTIRNEDDSVILRGIHQIRLIGGTLSSEKGGMAIWEPDTDTPTSQGLVIIRVAEVPIGGNRAVRNNPATGKIVYSDNQTSPVATESTLGISVNAADADEEVEVMLSGIMEEPSWNWIPGQPVFLTVDGLLTQIAPPLGNIVEVGVAETATKLLIRIQEPIYI